MAKTFYCPYCADAEGKHTSRLEVGEFESFGCYYRARCPSCNETFEIPEERMKKT